MKYFFIIIFVIFLSRCSDNSIIEVYEDGANKKERYLLGNSQYEEVFYYNNGSIKEKGLTLENLKIGTWKGWYKNGKLKYVENYKMNIPFGEFQTFYPNEMLETEGSYNEEGELINSWIKYSNKGDTTLFGNYENGNKTGVWKEISDKGDTINFTEYHYQGCAKSKGLIINAQKDGTWLSWYMCDIEKSIIHYNNGVKNGLYIDFYEFGDTNSIGNYKNDERIGSWKEWYEDGQINSVEIYDTSYVRLMEFWDEKGNQLIRNGYGKIEETSYINGRPQ